MNEFTPRYPQDDDREELISFSKSEFYDLIYAARDAHIRYKRLRTQVRENASQADPDYVSWKIDDCTEAIEHYNAMEDWLRKKYREAFGVYW